MNADLDPQAWLYMFGSVMGIRIRVFLGLPDPHPDLLVRGTDPRIRIRTKMSRIPNTGSDHVCVCVCVCVCVS
jgi:hypothetical protein